MEVKGLEILTAALSTWPGPLLLLFRVSGSDQAEETLAIGVTAAPADENKDGKEVTNIY